VGRSHLPTDLRVHFLLSKRWELGLAVLRDCTSEVGYFDVDDPSRPRVPLEWDGDVLEVNTVLVTLTVCRGVTGKRLLGDITIAVMVDAAVGASWNRLLIVVFRLLSSVLGDLAGV
jgi:hypothetical protein